MHNMEKYKVIQC